MPARPAALLARDRGRGAVGDQRRAGLPNAADVASLTTAEQAGCLRALEQATARHAAARSKILAAFHAQEGSAGDGHGSTRTWLKWQTRLTPQCAAAVAAVLEALGKRAGPEDLRSKWQRSHDALEEACRR